LVTFGAENTIVVGTENIKPFQDRDLAAGRALEQHFVRGMVDQAGLDDGRMRLGPPREG
jgi:hypothetical protein